MSKICPILPPKDYGPFPQCRGHGCAWWCDDRCAIVHIATGPYRGLPRENHTTRIEPTEMAGEARHWVPR